MPDVVKDYFNKRARTWGDTDSAVIKERNGYVLTVLRNVRSGRFLDVGCGTGELVRDAASLGFGAAGIDFSPEMIRIAKIKSAGRRGVLFTCGSVFDIPLGERRYTVISANGLIEYLSTFKMLEFFDLVYDALLPGGSFVLSSRNRLFNLISMNAYTEMEIKENAVGLLMKEAVAWNANKSIADLAETEYAMCQPPDAEHPNTGIGIGTRFQYTPLQLIGFLRTAGFYPVEVYPIHIHGDTPAPLAHASSFMLHVKKGE